MGVSVAKVEKEVQAHRVQMEWAWLALLPEEYGGSPQLEFSWKTGCLSQGTPHPLTGAAIGSWRGPQLPGAVTQEASVFLLSHPIPEGQTLGGRVRSLSPHPPSYKAHELDLCRRVKECSELKMRLKL